jgi:hypothetical protein
MFWQYEWSGTNIGNTSGWQFGKIYLSFKLYINVENVNYIWEYKYIL